jgi:hypothetical protein
MAVYIVERKDVPGIVKIGCAHNVDVRVKALERALSIPLKLLRTYEDCSFSEERAIHRLYDKFRISGEWFRLDVSMLLLTEEEIQALRPKAAYKIPNRFAADPDSPLAQLDRIIWQVGKRREYLASVLGLSPAHFSHYTAGRRSFSGRQIARLAKALDMDAGILLGVIYPDCDKAPPQKRKRKKAQ